MLEAPLAIDNTSPHFSWTMSSSDNGMSTTAYQILVATEPGKLNEQEADLWNSGKVNGNLG
jgi:alpha-L-rhamnosidase